MNNHQTAELPMNHVANKTEDTKTRDEFQIHGLVKRSKRFDRFFRRFFPSTATLSRNWLFKGVGYVNDFLMRRLFSEFRALPPNHLRVRVGVGNRIFNNHVLCLLSGTNFWIQLFANGLCKLNSNIVEIGCGYGRKGVHLAKFQIQGERFTGTYLGIDIDPELLAFAKKSLPAPQFRVQQTAHISKTYMSKNELTEKGAGGETHIDCPNDSQDLVFSTSLYTHLLEKEVDNYTRESYRVLKPGGVMQMNIFCLDYFKDAGLLGSRWNFQYQIGPAYVESKEYPEAAVAYTADYLKELCKSIGFSRTEIVCDPTGKAAQSYLRCWK
jgi:SAM-dependent methyltransferase